MEENKKELTPKELEAIEKKEKLKSEILDSDFSFSICISRRL